MPQNELKAEISTIFFILGRNYYLLYHILKQEALRALVFLKILAYLNPLSGENIIYKENEFCFCQRHSFLRSYVRDAAKIKGLLVETISIYLG